MPLCEAFVESGEWCTNEGVQSIYAGFEETDETTVLLCNDCWEYRTDIVDNRSWESR